ncbi:unnamed protein product [Miscanthus lutarioriparius]|uniref:PRORP domain-containing protein n=1 Tax=Miscanthus lutarioriparius TaxID=422564 RepID=A0A811SIW9_9POAL|nr:unnamed protein product [Miscanthus lutarioriparius]
MAYLSTTVYHRCLLFFLHPPRLPSSLHGEELEARTDAEFGVRGAQGGNRWTRDGNGMRAKESGKVGNSRDEDAGRRNATSKSGNTGSGIASIGPSQKLGPSNQRNLGGSEGDDASGGHVQDLGKNKASLLPGGSKTQPVSIPHFATVVMLKKRLIVKAHMLESGIAPEEAELETLLRASVVGRRGDQLAIIDLDPKETEEFARFVAKLAIKRENLNFENFQKWLEKHGPFEAVVDAANVNAVADAIRQRSRKWPLIVLHNKHLTGEHMKKPGHHKLVEKWKQANSTYATLLAQMMIDAILDDSLQQLSLCILN